MSLTHSKKVWSISVKLQKNQNNEEAMITEREEANVQYDKNFLQKLASRDTVALNCKV
jgi:hypothetical protein